MDRDSVARIIKEVLVNQQARGSLEPLEDSERLSAGRLNITSLSFITIVLALENALGIRFDDSAFMDADFETVGGLIDYVYSRFFGASGSEKAAS